MMLNSSGPGDREFDLENGCFIFIKGDEILINVPDLPRVQEENQEKERQGTPKTKLSILMRSSEFNGLDPETEFTGPGKIKVFIGYTDENPTWVINIPPDSQPAKVLAGSEHSWYNTRRLIPLLSPAETAACMRANHLRLWANESRYCGRCGGKTIFHTKEIARHCPSCGLVQYPRISPAVITRITKGEEILLAHHRRFPGNFHSLIAGFTEAGESLEETVIREIKEEIGLEVKNIRYFGSQPWPFPNSLMCGFTAEWAGGRITPDGDEIDKAGWFTRDSMPPIPGHGSISRVLIDDFLES